MNRRIMALDISPNRIGCALSDFNGIFVAQSFLIKDHFVDHLKEIYEEFTPITTYIGLPVNLNGSFSHQTRFVKNFIHNNRQLFKPFVFRDERFTTKLAKMLSNQKSADEIVAEILLRYQLEDNNKNK